MVQSGPGNPTHTHDSGYKRNSDPAAALCDTVPVVVVERFLRMHDIIMA
jgi:hypothetical protein